MDQKQKEPFILGSSILSTGDQSTVYLVDLSTMRMVTFLLLTMNLLWHAYLQQIKFQERTRIQEMSTETPTYMFMGKLSYNFGCIRFKFVSQV